MKTTWTEEEVDKLKSCVGACMTMLAASTALGKTYATVRYKAIKLRIEFNGPGGRMRKANWERAKKLAADGCWLKKASRIMGLHHSTLIYISRQMEFKWPPAPPQWQRFALKTSKKAQPIKVTPKYDPREDHEDAARIERMLEIAGRCA